MHKPDVFGADRQMTFGFQFRCCDDKTLRVSGGPGTNGRVVKFYVASTAWIISNPKLIGTV